jgi:hypothetical protein
MPPAQDHRDRGFSADEIEELVEALNSLLARSDTAELFDHATRERIGALIARSAMAKSQEETRRSQADDQAP